MAEHCSLQEIARGARRIADDRAYPESLRRQAGDIGDIADLLETWPVSRTLALEFDREIRRRVPGLCRDSGGAFCGMQACRANDEAAGEPLCLCA